MPNGRGGALAGAGPRQRLEAGMVPGLWFVVVAFAGEAAVLRGQLAGGLRRSRARLGPEGAVDEAGREGDEDCSGDGANDGDHIAAATGSLGSLCIRARAVREIDEEVRVRRGTKPAGARGRRYALS